MERAWKKEEEERNKRNEFDKYQLMSSCPINTELVVGNLIRSQ
jgi:hypothetical protein